MAERARLLLYCQHLKGAGHYVRARELARACAQRFDTCLVSGGRAVPGRELPPLQVDQRQLTGLWRPPAGLAPTQAGRGLQEVMQERSHQLHSLLEEKRPHILLIEHFPFSKWFLEKEVLAMIETARKLRSDLQVVCSVRDYPLGQDGERDPASFRHSVLPLLNASFDLLLVHADPQVVTLDRQFDWIDSLRIPVHYTGYVSQPLSPAGSGKAVDLQGSAGKGDVLVSSGGLWDGWRLATLAIEAWWLLHRQGRTEGRRMRVFAGLDTSQEELAEFRSRMEGGPFVLHPFSTTFLEELAGAALSLSQGGYNTTMNLLQTGSRAIVAPNRSTQDQWPRARRMEQLGLVTALDPEATTAAQLAARMAALLANPAPVHRLNLDGAQATAERLDQLLDTHAARQPGSGLVIR